MCFNTLISQIYYKDNELNQNNDVILNLKKNDKGIVHKMCFSDALYLKWFNVIGIEHATTY